MTRGRHHNTAHLVADTVEEARAQWVDVFSRDRADLGPGHAAQTAAEDIERYGPLAHAHPSPDRFDLETQDRATTSALLSGDDRGSRPHHDSRPRPGHRTLRSGPRLLERLEDIPGGWRRDGEVGRTIRARRVTATGERQ